MNERRFWPFLYNRKEAIKTNDFVFCNFYSCMHCWQISKTLFFCYIIFFLRSGSWTTSNANILYLLRVLPFDWFITLRVVLEHLFFFENLFIACGLENCRMKRTFFYCAVEMQLCCFYVDGRFWAGTRTRRFFDKGSINKYNVWLWDFFNTVKLLIEFILFCGAEWSRSMMFFEVLIILTRA